jgi:hypothetical protein
MNEHNAEVWQDLARLSRHIVLVEQLLLRRILALENEVATLKGPAPADRDTYPDAHEINWCSPDVAKSTIARIMQE